MYKSTIVFTFSSKAIMITVHELLQNARIVCGRAFDYMTKHYSFCSTNLEKPMDILIYYRNKIVIEIKK